MPRSRRLRTLIFSLRETPLTSADLLTLPGLPKVASAVAGDTSGLDLDILDELELGLEGGRAVWHRIASEQLPAELDTLRGLIARHSLLEPAFPETLGRVREVMEVSLESESDVDVDNFEELVVGLSERLDGFSLWPHGVFDGLGRALLDMRDAEPPLHVPVTTATTAPNSPRLLPTPDVVIARARALAALARRGVLEAGVRSAETEAEVEHLRRVVETSMLLPGAVSPGEQALVTLGFGTWSQRTLVDATWLTENVALLAWGLDWGPLPADTEMVESEFQVARFALVDATPLPAPAGTRLRRRSELEAELKRQTSLRTRLLEVLALDATPAPISLGDGPPERFDTVAGLNTERVRALEWLLGEPLYFA